MADGKTHGKEDMESVLALHFSHPTSKLHPNAHAIKRQTDAHIRPLQPGLGRIIKIRLAPPQLVHGLAHHIQHDVFCRLDIFNNGRDLAHQKRRVNVDIVLHVVGQRHDALVGQLLDLLRLTLPFLEVVVHADAQGPAAHDQRAQGVGEIGRDDGFLVQAAGARLLGGDEARADPDADGALHERAGEAAAVVDAAGGDDEGGLAGQRAGVSAGDVADGGDEDAVGDVAGVAAAFAALGADHVDAGLEGLFGVFRGADHVHDEDAGGVQAGNDVWGWDANGGDEEFGARVDGDGDEVVELAVGVVVVGLAGGAADLGEGQVDAKRERLIGQVCFEVVDDLGVDKGVSWG